jgi:hypothetical protein
MPRVSLARLFLAALVRVPLGLTVQRVSSARVTIKATQPASRVRVPMLRIAVPTPQVFQVLWYLVVFALVSRASQALPAILAHCSTAVTHPARQHLVPTVATATVTRRPFREVWCLVATVFAARGTLARFAISVTLVIKVTRPAHHCHVPFLVTAQITRTAFLVHWFLDVLALVQPVTPAPNVTLALPIIKATRLAAPLHAMSQVTAATTPRPSQVQSSLVVFVLVQLDSLLAPARSAPPTTKTIQLALPLFVQALRIAMLIQFLFPGP